MRTFWCVLLLISASPVAAQPKLNIFRPGDELVKQLDGHWTEATSELVRLARSQGVVVQADEVDRLFQSVEITLMSDSNYQPPVIIIVANIIEKDQAYWLVQLGGQAWTGIYLREHWAFYAATVDAKGRVTINRRSRARASDIDRLIRCLAPMSGIAKAAPDRWISAPKADPPKVPKRVPDPPVNIERSI